MSNFRRVLNEVSKHIDSDTLKSMKYMCGNDVVPAKMEKVTTPLDLLNELEVCGKIRDGDVQFLISLLDSENKPMLVEKLTQFNYSANESSFQESLSFRSESHQSQQQPSLNPHDKSIPSHLSWTAQLPLPGENLPYTNTMHCPQSAADPSRPEQNRPHSLAVTTRDILAIDKRSFNVQVASQSPFAEHHSSQVTRINSTAPCHSGQQFPSDTANTSLEAQNICEPVSAPSFQHHMKGEVSCAPHPSTNMVNELHSIGTPQGSSSRIASRETVLTSESMKPQQLVLESPTRRRELDQQSQTQLETGHATNNQPAVSDIHNEFASENISVPTQAVDDDFTEVTLQNVMEQKECIMSQKDKMDGTTYQSCLQQLEKEELQCKRKLHQQMPLQTKLQNAVNTSQFESKLEDIITRKKSIELQSQAVDDELHEHIQELEIKCIILMKQVEMLKANKEDMADPAKHCECHLLWQERKENKSLQQQLQTYKHLYQQEAENVEKLKAYMLSLTCPTERKYLMNKSPHGIAVIIINHAFYSTTPSSKLLPNSRGTKSDIKNLRTTWEHLGYSVDVLSDLSALELANRLKQIASTNHENYDSFVCCILSHGYLDGVYGSDGEIVKIDDIASLFKHNPTLAGKPKLFFIYTCCENVAGREAAAVAKNPSDYLPTETDFLFICSINMSWRSRSNYISTFCEVTKIYAAQKHLLSLLNTVDDKMSEADEHQKCKLKCCPASNITPLHKEMWFFER